MGGMPRGKNEPFSLFAFGFILPCKTWGVALRVTLLGGNYDKLQRSRARAKVVTWNTNQDLFTSREFR